MKKLLLTALISLFLIYPILSQTLSLSWEGVEIPHGDTIYVYGEVVEDNMFYEILSYALVHNTGDRDMDVLAKRNEIEIVPGTINELCWGACFPPDINVSPMSINIPAGGVTDPTTFNGHYKPQAQAGTSIIEYTFFDEDNPADSVSMTVFYVVTPADDDRSLGLTWDGAEIHHGDTIYLYGEVVEDDAFYEIKSYVLVKNKTDVDLDVLAKRNEIEIVPGTINELCWETCFPPHVNVATRAVTIPAGETTDTTTFNGHYKPQAQAGTSIIDYTFFLADNPDDSITMRVFYVVSPSSLNEFSALSVLGNAYPNPASTQVSFDYTLQAGIKNAYIRIYDIAGKQIMAYPLNPAEKTVKLPVNELVEGIYFYALSVDNKHLVVRKLIINR